MSNPRIAIVISHPIQHFCPQYASFASLNIADIKVFFASSMGLKTYFDPQFGKQVSWGNLYLDKFDHEFLNGDAMINPDKNIDAVNLEEKLNEFKPDMLIIYGYAQRLQRRAYRWALKHKVKLAYISDSENRQKKNVLKEWLKYPFLRYYFTRINYFLSVGDANEELYRSYGVADRKLIRMHFPIDREMYRSRFPERVGLSDALRKKYGVPAGEIVLSVVGKLVPWKSQEHIIEALRLLEKDGTVYHLFMIGSGPKEAEWKELAATLKHSKVYFTGFVDPVDLPGFYAFTDVYVHPSEKDRHPLSISEAIYMGCPIIVSDVCGSYGDSDDVRPGYNGFVFKFGNIREMADRIPALKDAGIRASFGSRSHELATRYQQLSHEEVLNKLVNACRK